MMRFEWECREAILGSTPNKHTHTGDNRVELHFVTPRVELYTGKSLNIAPPGWHGYFKPWQTSINIKQGWARPDDPSRKRVYEPGYMALINADREAKGLEPLTDTRQLLTEYVLSRVEAGLISDRHDIIALFKEELGLEITRAGSDYITVLDPETDSRCRLKGKLYEREFRPEPEITAEVRQRASGNSGVNAKELLEVTERIESNYQSRAEYHRERYKVPKLNSNQDVGQVLADSCWGRVEPLSGYIRRQLGDDFILDESDKPEAGNIGLSRREDRFSGSRDKTAATDFRVNPETDSRDNDYANGQRNISDSAELLDSNSWLEMPGKTLSEIGVRVLKDTPSDIEDERTGKQANDRFRKVSRAIQARHDEFVPQIQHGHEAVREAEQAASYSSSEFERTSLELERASLELERANQEALRIQQQIDFNLHRIRGALKQKKAKQLERFKTEINLVEYAIAHGYEYIEPKSAHNRAILRHESGDKIVVVTDTRYRGLYFSLKDSNDNGTIIDFIQHRSNLNLGEVRLELRPWLNRSDKPVLKDTATHNGMASLLDEVRSKPQPMSEGRISLIEEFTQFSVLTNHPYLAKLGISNSTLNDEKFIGRIAVDGKDNVIFPYYDDDGLAGYEIYNDSLNSFNRSGTKALWKSNYNSEDTRLVFTKTAIDALSYHQLFPKEHTRYISTEGMPSSYQRELIRKAIAEFNFAGKEVIIAIDNDEADNQLVDTITSLIPNDTQIKCHQLENAVSWNEMLQKQIENNKSSVQQSKQKLKQKKRSQLQP